MKTNSDQQHRHVALRADEYDFNCLREIMMHMGDNGIPFPTRSGAIRFALLMTAKTLLDPTAQFPDCPDLAGNLVNDRLDLSGDIGWPV